MQDLTDLYQSVILDHNRRPRNRGKLPTANRVAQTLHVPGREFAKTVLLRTGHGYALAVLPATHRVDLGRASFDLGENVVEMANEEEIVRLFPDCERGAIPPFGSLYQVPTIVDDALADIVVGRFDAGIRVGGRLEKDMVAVRLTPDLNMVAVASPDYLARRGTPKSPAELHEHACINWRLQMDGRHYRWEFEKRGQRVEVAVDGPVVTNHAHIGIAAALNGLGIAYHFERDGVGELMAQGRLVQVLADWSISRPGLFLYYPNRQHRPALLGAFIDCLLDRKPFDLLQPPAKAS